MSIIRFYRKMGFFGKVILPILIILPLGTVLNAVYLKNNAERTTIESSVLFAKATIEQFKILRSYYTESVVTKAKTHGAMQIGFDHHGKPDTIPLPATMIHDLSEKFARSESGLKLRLYSEFPFPNRNDRALDEFSKEAIDYFKENPDGTLSRITNGANGEIVRVAIADKMVAQSCVQCHNSHAQSPFKEWKLGDVRGVLEVEVPIHKQIAANEAMVVYSGGFRLGTAIVLLLTIILILFFFVARPVKHIVQSLDTSADDTLKQSSSLASASQEVSSACTEQSSAVQETVATLDEIRAMAAKSVDGAKSSMDMSKNSHSIAMDGKRSVEEMIHAIEEIEASQLAVTNQIDESNQKMAEIVKVITEIGSKTQVINDIVFQTKLLSFNASVEAARAGENGKGFAVVAEEVGNLARMSGTASKEISDMLDDSIRKVESIVQETRANVDGIVKTGQSKVAAGNVIAKRCGEILDKVVHNVNEVDAMMAEICGAAEEQAKGISGISEAMAQIDLTTHQNASSAEKTSAISEELMDQAQALRELVLSFKVQALGGDLKEESSQLAEVIPLESKIGRGKSEFKKQSG